MFFFSHFMLPPSNPSFLCFIKYLYVFCSFTVIIQETIIVDEIYIYLIYRLVFWTNQITYFFCSRLINDRYCVWNLDSFVYPIFSFLQFIFIRHITIGFILSSLILL